MSERTVGALLTNADSISAVLLLLLWLLLLLLSLLLLLRFA